MEAGGQSEKPAQATRTAAEISSRLSRLMKRRALRARDVQLYRVCEELTEPLIYFMVVVGPWAFGTTQSWSIWLMSEAGYLLGLLLAGKLAIRWLKGYHPPRWDDGKGREVQSPETESRGQGGMTASGLTAILAWLTVAILGYCLISALNARATFHRDELSFAYHGSFIRWLPHSFDSSRSWLAFWTYLGLAFSFWAVRDWLLGKSEVEERAERRKPQPGGDSSAFFLPARLRRLLWVLALNGGLLGLEGIAQRLEGSGKLLFLVKPRVNPAADTQFGPYAYRANASQYFNLLWPVCLAFWWTLNRSVGFKRKAYHLVLVCCGVMAACPIISTSRGGALVTLGIAVLAAFFLAATHFLLAAHRQQDRRTRITTLAALLLFFAGALALGLALGWKSLKPRMAHISEDSEYREQMYENARPMAADYPLFGTGPGTFESVFQLYRKTTDTYWPAQLHNDWLETRITFGWVGSGLIALSLIAVVLRWFARGGIHGGRRFIILIWLALAGCLVHARYDFPFQVHSIVFLFLVLCAILFNLTRRP
jgi:O-antigen ligase